MAQLKHRSHGKLDPNPLQIRHRSRSPATWRPRLIEGNPAIGRAPTHLAKPPKLLRRKRVFDIVFGAALIIFLAPLMLVIAALVKLDGGPVLYGHRRGGANGQRFPRSKFRGMVADAGQVRSGVLRSHPAAAAP